MHRHLPLRRSRASHALHVLHALCMLLAVLTAAATAAAEVIICEIMYNPDSDESSPNDVEWVEIVNTGNQPVVLAGWRLADEDAQTGPIGPIGENGEDITLLPNGVLVLIPDTLTQADFHAAWGPDVSVARLAHWGRPGQFNLANQPAADNEQLVLQRADGSAVDTVNYQAADPWPASRPDGPSIYLLPGRFDSTANNAGSAWARSVVGRDGAKANHRTAIFDGEDIGSPGVVVRETVAEPQPPLEHPGDESANQMPPPPTCGPASAP